MALFMWLRVALEIAGAALVAKWMTAGLSEYFGSDDRRDEASEKPGDGRGGDDRIPKKSDSSSTKGVIQKANVQNLPLDTRISLTFNTSYQPIGKEANYFEQFLCIMARMRHLCPINYLHWHQIPNEYKEKCWYIIKSKFIILEDETAERKIKQITMHSLSKKWSEWKDKLKVEYFDESKDKLEMVASLPDVADPEHFAFLVDFWLSDARKGVIMDDDSHEVSPFIQQKSSYTSHDLQHGKGGDHQNRTKTIKIMTYNIWFREDMQLKERINAIGHLIEKHSPDIIFFQEVTHVIHEIFQSFEWWKVYEHSILPNKKKKGHFCMLLCKLPVKSSGSMRFENSTLGRDLYTASVEVGMGKKLVVATTHLKSPNPPEMHCPERMAQAKKALGFLDDFPNVVFGGDMNWDEHTDGPFPLRDGWADAWARLRPGENGWTFDTWSNPMLKDRRLLQKRLDRFLCKLKDFELVRVHIIGKEAIPGILCYDNMRNKIVPALPSDHYGLLLTVRVLGNKGLNNNDKSQD